MEPVKRFLFWLLDGTRGGPTRVRLLAILDAGVKRHAPGRLAALTATLLAIAAVRWSSAFKTANSVLPWLRKMRRFAVM